MKKLFIFVVGLLMAGNMAAQPHKGAVILTGSLTFTTYNYTFGSNGNNNTFSISPSVDYFTSDHWSIGGQISFSRSHQETEYNDETVQSTNTSTYLGVRNNYYIYVNERLFLSFNGIAQFGIIDAPYYGNTNIKRIYLSCGITPALNYYLTQHWAATIAMGNIGISFVIDDRSISSTFGVSNSSGLNLGISYTF